MATKTIEFSMAVELYEAALIRSNYKTSFCLAHSPRISTFHFTKLQDNGSVCGICFTNRVMFGDWALILEDNRIKLVAQGAHCFSGCSFYIRMPATCTTCSVFLRRSFTDVKTTKQCPSQNACPLCPPFTSSSSSSSSSSKGHKQSSL